MIEIRSEIDFKDDEFEEFREEDSISEVNEFLIPTSMSDSISKKDSHDDCILEQRDNCAYLNQGL